MQMHTFLSRGMAAAVLIASLQSNVLQATTQGPDVSTDAAIQVAQSVVSGRFTGRGETQLWIYEDALNDLGQIEPETEVVTAHEFKIDDTLDGAPLSGTIRINIPGGRHNRYETPQRQKLPEPDTDIVIGVNADRAATQRGFGGYNLVHGKILPVTQTLPLARIKETVKKIRRPTRAPNPEEAQAEMMEESLVGVDFNHEYVSIEQNHSGDMPPEDSLSTRQETPGVVSESTNVASVASKQEMQSPSGDSRVRAPVASPVKSNLHAEKDGVVSSPLLLLLVLIALLVVGSTLWFWRRHTAHA